MCGIWGAAGPNLPDAETLSRGLGALGHRGPDDSGNYRSADGRAFLGHRRLSIIDLSEAGRQPMTNEDDSFWLSFNGEIYNYPELRRQLLAAGHRFKSRTDSEVILHLYEEDPDNFIKQLRGMFSFAIWDDRRKRLVLVRDRLGIKPLYYAEHGGNIYFASEAKALFSFSPIKARLNNAALPAYLTFLWVPDPGTLFEGIYKLPPGHLLVYENGCVNVMQYWDMDMGGAPAQSRLNPPSFSVSEDDWDGLAGNGDPVSALRKLMVETVKCHLLSDVPVGIFLSGGLDSSVLAAMVAQAGMHPTAFTVFFRPDDARYEIVGDDRPYAAQVAKKFGLHHEEIELTPKVTDLLPKLAWQMDEPVADPAAISAYLICEQAKKHFKVLLSGMGADEVFAGYPRHKALALSRCYDKIPGFVRNGLIRSLVRSVPGGYAGGLTALLRNARKFEKSAGLPFSERYLGFCRYYNDEELSSLFAGSAMSPILQAGNYGTAVHRNFNRRSGDWHWLNQALYMDIKTYLPCLNLAYMDRMSMAHSIEVRVPYVDHKVVEFSGAVPPEMKLKGLNGKWILKQAAKGLLPDEIINRKKTGFTAPIRAWLKHDLKNELEEYLGEETLRRRGLFNPDEVNRMREDTAGGRSDYHYQLWALMTLEIWMRTYIDHDKPKMLS